MNFSQSWKLRFKLGCEQIPFGVFMPSNSCSGPNWWIDRFICLSVLYFFIRECSSWWRIKVLLVNDSTTFTDKESLNIRDCWILAALWNFGWSNFYCFVFIDWMINLRENFPPFVYLCEKYPILKSNLREFNFTPRKFFCS